jgi:hypothetical protein
MTDDDDGPDTLVVAYADPSAQAVVTAMASGNPEITVDDVDRFEEGDLAVIVDGREPPTNVSPTPPQEFDACVVKIADVGTNSITVDTLAPWGDANNSHCNAVASRHQIETPTDTMIYRFAYRAYRIDLTRDDLAVLQLSETGGVEDDWEDIGLDFTDLQIASRWFENDVETWYSDEAQEGLTAPSALDPTSFPTQVTVSFVVRSNDGISGVVSTQTPSLTEEGNEANNPIGNRAAVQLEGVDDASRPVENAGNRVYRWATVRVDLRNLAVSR